MPPVVEVADPLGDDDLQLALYACDELHHRSFEGVEKAWEWQCGLLAARHSLEAPCEYALRDTVDVTGAISDGVEAALREMVADDDGPPLSRTLERDASLEQFGEFVMHRSAYQRKEADPHSWVVPRLAAQRVAGRQVIPPARPLLTRPGAGGRPRCSGPPRR